MEVCKLIILSDTDPKLLTEGCGARDLCANFVKKAPSFGFEAVVCTSGDINLHKGEVVYCRILNENGEWVRRRFSGKIVCVYDRYVSKNSQMKVRVKKIREFFRKKKIYMMPSKEFMKFSVDKLMLFKEFSQDPVLKDFLPDTILFQNKITKEVVDFFDKYKFVIVKPRFGSKGRNVVLVSRVKSGYEFFYVTRKSGIIDSHSGVLKDLSELSGLLKNLKFYYKNYIIQQAIDCLKYKGSVFDLRTVYQKSSFVSFARVGKKGYITSNVSIGGYLIDPAEIFKKVPDSGNVIRQFDKLQKLLVEKIGRRFDIPEFASDITIDVDGKLWLLEFNSIPGYIYFDCPEKQDVLDKFVENICRYVVGFL